ncbi:gluconate 2-dehydrogenase subunit 3 family protein [Aurantimonas sp. Leaf443]|uniref:gluconate 2-dehydrogenase subunit 3 family protein n=1 Tax=Aurantimonas sp. Leaf443 TaxID=1736378 RepID=UPI0006FAD532|nr:gluconate 2-dehydrogenase subunit 3 family protein [Aurantimonas sp. Leaf443]KQT85466.1 hypothetical protein ASG48_09565 [Aurantimonas sp. Leaf443]
MDETDVHTLSDQDMPRAEAPDYEAFIASDRVSPRLRAILEERARPDDAAYRPKTMTDRQFETLRAVLSRLIPQEGPQPIDLAARLDTMMAQETGNGWRYEALPTDPDAYRGGLDTLDALAFRELGPQAGDALLERLQAGEETGGPGPFTAAQMKLWFEELRSDAVRLYVAHPATMARIGYSGIGNGGADGAAFSGFRKVGMDEREPFEPLPETAPEQESAS